jgi:N-acetylglucosamine kinase-like BadF-type ATPase
VAVYNDAHLLGGALLTHHCPWGVAVIAGTGSVVICLEVDEDGEVSQIGRRGGTGYLLGDDGSGQLPLSCRKRPKLIVSI